MSVPVALFVYNRPSHTTRTLAALAACPESADTDLVVYSDGPKNDAGRQAVMECRALVRVAAGFHSVRLVEREGNLGLSKNIVGGISEVLEQSEEVIVLEDDIEVTPDFLSFMNAALSHYEGRPDIFAVSGYLYPVPMDARYAYDSFLFSRFSCWGWATWRAQWNRVEWKKPDKAEFLAARELFQTFRHVSNDLPEMMLDLIQGRNDSWSILFNYAQVRHHGYSVHPVRSLVQNTGFDGTGTHAGSTGRKTGVPPAPGFNGARGFRFAETHDPEYVESLRRFFVNRPRRKLKNLVRYGRYF